jgi:crotonobetainyl-CoA:carnitine CoA-transferase CaiB-like acyl-CoA transferase
LFPQTLTGVRAIDRDDLAQDERFFDNTGRVAEKDLIDGAISEWAASLPMEEALEVLETAAVAGGPILNVEDMFNHPHYQARGAFEEVTVDGEILHIPAIAPRLVDTPGRTERPGPQLGEHTDAVLAELLGLDEVKTQLLRDAGVV